VGFCLDVSDPSLPECDTEGVAAFELKKAIPDSAAVSAAADAIVASLPIGSATCVFSDGVEVPLGANRRGAPKLGKGLIKIKAKSADARPKTDTDALQLRCLPE
jgi:hypothetical protein